MLSINTNLQSLITQKSLKASTLKLNTAVERMTTGYKINHAKDNAANYTITTNLTTQLSAYDMAEENTLMGIDMLTTTMDTLSLMSDSGERLRALVTQALNGTYGKNSVSAIKEEANSIVANINRIMHSAEYNGITLINDTSIKLPDTMPKTGDDGFINNAKTYTDAEIASMKPISSVTSFTAGETYSISSADELKQLSDMVQTGTDTTNVTFVLVNDINLSSFNNWQPIGNATTTTSFKGVFDGNGHKISNLKIDSSNNNCALFGRIQGATIKNLGIENADIKTEGANSGCIVGIARNTSSIDNCYSTGKISCNSGGIGGILGTANEQSSITNCWSSADVIGKDGVGGIVGFGITIKNSFSIGNCTGVKNLGGVAGYISNEMSNCYAAGDITLKYNNTGMHAGGLIGYLDDNSAVKDCIALGSVTASDITPNTIEYGAGGLIGRVYYRASITNCSAYGDVNANTSFGSFIGTANSSGLTLTNCSTTARENCTPIGYMASSSTKTKLEEAIKIKEKPNHSINLQVGIYSEDSNQISFNTDLDTNISQLLLFGIDNKKTLEAIDKFLRQIDEKNTQLGSTYNRLESVIDSISVQHDNLVSTRSTLRDADIADVSSEYIKQQILQQAGATLLATANQSPALALQLL